MSREVRKVPANWEHPKNERGSFIALYATFPYTEEEVREGLRDGWLEDDAPNYGIEVMPNWPEAERTHFQMYETVSEGTPISPVMESPEALARWLASNNASAGGDRTATYEQWLRTATRGWAPSFVSESGGPLLSGVEGH